MTNPNPAVAELLRRLESMPTAHQARLALSIALKHSTRLDMAQRLDIVDIGVQMCESLAITSLLREILRLTREHKGYGPPGDPDLAKFSITSSLSEMTNVSQSLTKRFFTLCEMLSFDETPSQPQSTSSDRERH